MRKKKILVHGTLESLYNFFADAVSRDFEVVALISEENISSDLETFTPQNLPRFVYGLIDGIILTEPHGSQVKYFLKQGIEPRKIILYNAQEGWGNFNLPDADGSQVIYFCGQEFHIRNQSDVDYFVSIQNQFKTDRLVKNSSPQVLEDPVNRVRQKFLSEIKLPPSPENIPQGKVIASLTSWTKRIDTVHLAIQTILNQTRRPDLTVLYLATEEFPRREDDLPPELLALRSERFEIRWTKNIFSYKKLIPALKDFPDDIIITFDDDLFFHPELIERSLKAYQKNPQLIQCHRIHNNFFDAAGNLIWSLIPYDRPTYLQSLSGGLGCLYPPHCLYKDVLDEEKFMTLAPTNDDIWFWLMGVLNGRRVNCVEDNLDVLNYISGTQKADVALWQINNFNEGFLYKSVENILNAYPILREILNYEQRLAYGQ